MLLLLSAIAVLAQPTLPDLDPNVVEIRSRAEISFPSLPRPSLSLLVPPPGTFRLAPDRKPVMGNNKQSASTFPKSALQPPPDPSPVSLARSRRNTFLLDLEGGRFFTRQVDLLVNTPVDNLTDIFIRAEYDGSDGHAPFDDQPDVLAAYDVLDAEAGVKRNFGILQSSFSADGFYDSFTMYGADTLGFPIPSLIPHPNRTGVGIGGNLSVSTVESASVPFVVNLRYGAARYETDIFSNLDRVLDRNEKRLDGSVDFSVPFGMSNAFAGGSMTVGGLDTDAVLNSDHITYNARAGFTFKNGDSFRFMLGGQISGYEVSDINTGTVDENESYLMPIARLDVYPGPGLNLYVQQDPKPRAVGLVDMLQHNPYVVSQPVLKAEIPFLDIKGGIGWQNTAVKIGIHAGLEEMKQRLFFEATTKARYADYKGGFFEALYGPSRVLYAGADVSTHLFNSVRFALSGQFRQGELIGQDGNPDKTIPYFPDLVARASLLYFFDQGKGTIELAAEYQDERYTDRNESETLNPGGFANASSRISYEMMPGFTLTGALKRINSGMVEPWKNYPVEQFVAMGGIKIHM